VPSGSLFVQIKDEWAGYVQVFLDRLLHWRNTVIWHYRFGTHQKGKFGRNHQQLLHYVADPRKATFNADAIREPSARHHTGLWGAESGVLLRNLDTRRVSSLAFSPDGKMLATAEGGGGKDSSSHPWEAALPRRQGWRGWREAHHMPGQPSNKKSEQCQGSHPIKSEQ
jgi:hypothetical protein